MAKSKKSTFPDSIREHRVSAKVEAEKASAKIDQAFQKLAKKMRERADKAKSKMEETRKPEKRAVLLRRSNCTVMRRRISTSTSLTTTTENFIWPSFELPGNVRDCSKMV